MHYRTLFFAAAFTAALAFTIPANAQSVGQFSGTYVMRTEVGPGLVNTAFFALHSDGSLTQMSSNAVYSSILGVWEKSGPKTIRITEFTFISDGAGGIWGIGRSRMEMTFSNDLSTFKGTAYLEGVPCPTAQSCPDPADPNTKWGAAPTPPNPISGSRLEALPVGPLPLTTTNNSTAQASLIFRRSAVNLESLRRPSQSGLAGKSRM